MSDQKVVALTQPRRNERVVQAIREMLQEAERGEMVELMALTISRGGDLHTYSTPSDDLLRQLGMAMRLAGNIQKRMDKA